MYKLKAEETLENPARAGAEGARRKPNLSGKRTERMQIRNLSVFLRQSCLWAALFLF